jgi:DNA-binding Xre family transcriptional regulator
VSKRKPTYEDLFISPIERRERVLGLMPSRGFANINQLRLAMGIGFSQLERMLIAESVTVPSLCKLAQALQCKVSFLIER